MDTNFKSYSTVLLSILLSFSCTKNPGTCPKMGYEYIYSKPAITFTPGSDSLPLGSTIIIEASVPKSFYEEQRNTTVILNEPEIFGPLGIQKLTNDPISPRIGAIDDMELSTSTGMLIKDTVLFTEGQLKLARTAHMVSVSDSFKIRVICKPKIRGVFSITMSQVGNRDAECALFKYLLSVKNTEKHLYMLAPLYGYTPTDDRVYCFKIY